MLYRGFTAVCKLCFIEVLLNYVNCVFIEGFTEVCKLCFFVVLLKYANCVFIVVLLKYVNCVISRFDRSM